MCKSPGSGGHTADAEHSAEDDVADEAQRQRGRGEREHQRLTAWGEGDGGDEARPNGNDGEGDGNRYDPLTGPSRDAEACCQCEEYEPDSTAVAKVPPRVPDKGVVGFVGDPSAQPGWPTPFTARCSGRRSARCTLGGCGVESPKPWPIPVGDGPMTLCAGRC